MTQRQKTQRAVHSRAQPSAVIDSLADWLFTTLLDVLINILAEKNVHFWPHPKVESVTPLGRDSFLVTAAVGSHTQAQNINWLIDVGMWKCVKGEGGGL